MLSGIPGVPDLLLPNPERRDSPYETICQEIRFRRALSFPLLAGLPVTEWLQRKEEMCPVTQLRSFLSIDTSGPDFGSRDQTGLSAWARKNIFRHSSPPAEC
jgi:hypothetical protein